MQATFTFTFNWKIISFLKYKLSSLSNSIQNYLLCINISMTAMGHHNWLSSFRMWHFYGFCQTNKFEFLISCYTFLLSKKKTERKHYKNALCPVFCSAFMFSFDMHFLLKTKFLFSIMVIYFFSLVYFCTKCTLLTSISSMIRSHLMWSHLMWYVKYIYFIRKIFYWQKTLTKCSIDKKLHEKFIYYTLKKENVSGRKFSQELIVVIEVFPREVVFFFTYHDIWFQQLLFFSKQNFFLIFFSIKCDSGLFLTFPLSTFLSHFGYLNELY